MTTKDLMKLERDNKSFGKIDILVSEKSVSIWPGEWNISLSKKDFNRMIDWYNKEQA